MTITLTLTTFDDSGKAHGIETTVPSFQLISFGHEVRFPETERSGSLTLIKQILVNDEDTGGIATLDHALGTVDVQFFETMPAVQHLHEILVALSEVLSDRSLLDA